LHEYKKVIRFTKTYFCFIVIRQMFDSFT